MICVFFVGELVENTFTTEELLKLRIIMILLTINMMVTFIFNVVSMALLAYEKYIFIRMVTIIATLVTPIINIIALQMGGRAVAISINSLLISILSYLSYFIYARKAIQMEFVFTGFQKEIIKEILVFSSFLFLNSITDQIVFSTDNIVLSAVKGTTAVAIYTIGANFKGYFHQFSSAVGGCFGPMINLMVAKNKGIKALDEVFLRVGRVQFYVVSLILIGYISIGKDFVCLWAGKEYIEAFYIGLMLMISVFVPAFQNTGLEIQKALNKHKTRTIVYFIIAVGNIGLTIPFSKLWGGIGAALATMISMFLGRVLFMNFYYLKYMGMDIKGFWKSILSILPGYILPCVVGALVNRCWLINSFADILFAAILVSVVFFASIWFFSMNLYEKELVTSVLKKIRRKK